MKKLIIALTLAGCVGCRNLPSTPNRIGVSLYDFGGDLLVKVIKIDSCEYVSYGESIIYKGNCSNPIHNH